MNRLLLKQKLVAFAWHGLVTVLVAIIAGMLIFKVWYPNDFAAYVGGVELFKLVLLVELAVGPLMSLVIYNPAKPRTELIRDYCVVGLIQLSALGYGLYVVAEARPVYITFVKDRLEVVTALDIDLQDYKQVADSQSDPQFGSQPWLGPKRICVTFPTDAKEHNDLLLSAVGGKDIQYFPKYYRNCAEDEILSKALPKEQLIHIAKFKKIDYAELLPQEPFTWLPVKHRFGNWVEVYLGNDINKARFVKIDPYSAL